MSIKVPQPSPSTYFLVAHGSRDPRPGEALVKLTDLVSERISILVKHQKYGMAQMPLVGMGVLELGPSSLYEQLIEFGEQTLAIGLHKVQIVPLFLLSGVHVQEDLQTEIALANRYFASQYHELQDNISQCSLEIKLCHHLGLHPQIKNLLSTKITPVPDSWILISHGSKRYGANQPVLKIVNELQLLQKIPIYPAFWSIMPNLESCVQAMLEKGHQHIGILPYFLFEGTITDAIAQNVQAIAQKYPQVKLVLTSSLGVTADLVRLIIELVDF
ncbi:MAG: sirohydrochlorin chelatase [Microcoleaceae cyanobacterium]